jgi:hypothetical protein
MYTAHLPIGHRMVHLERFVGTLTSAVKRWERDMLK